ncbi:alpha/beta fold hydrolase [Dyella telluris]|uniref:Alpha/beta hydrolase n=1 Tax=Dyella telluris TaxID=2763498 RepID=A0A7G8Q3R3_9GAMM|nr:alpha/beta hydrolase [Dyella telluris]QNK01421.1 alpha/beta hydrolase [Dyella telluris]
MRTLLSIAIALMVSTGAAVASDAPPSPKGVKNIVIVPGAFVDASGWRVIHDILVHKGYSVTVEQPRVETLADDIDLTRELIRRQDGPVLLVGHSYGGAVITVAGNRDKVKGLVYVSALEPSEGESVSQLLGSMPAPSNDVVATRDDHLYVEPSKFAADFAGDLTRNRTDFMAVSQPFATKAAFDAMVSAAAWRTKPTWAVVTTEDHVLNPDLQRWMYKRAGSKVTEVKASHLGYISQPELIAKVIEDAATSVH